MDFEQYMNNAICSLVNTTAFCEVKTEVTTQDVIDALKRCADDEPKPVCGHLRARGKIFR